MDRRLRIKQIDNGFVIEATKEVQSPGNPYTDWQDHEVAASSPDEVRKVVNQWLEGKDNDFVIKEPTQ